MPRGGASGPGAHGDGERLEPVTDPAGHPDLPTLAGISGHPARLAGRSGTDGASAFDAETTRALRQHVESCVPCSAQADRIAAVRHQLAALPRPAMPDAVADRLTAALRAESAAQTTGPAGTTETAGTPHASRTDSQHRTGPATVPSLDAARARRSKRLRWLSGAAAAATIAAVAVVAVVVPHGRHTTTAGSGQQPVTSPSASGSAGPRATGSAAGSGLFGPQRSSRNAYGPAHTGPGFGKLRSLTPSTLAAAVPAIVKEAPVSLTGPVSIDSPAGELSQPSRRRACSTALVGAGHHPIAVEQVRFAGAPAYVVVYRTGGRYDVYVAGAACGTNGRVALYHTSVPA